MKSVVLPVSGVLLLVGTLWGGWWKGHTANRWGHDAALKVAAQGLSRPLGERLGNWRMVSEAPMPSDALQMLQCPAHINRTYINEQTGDTVSVFVVVGPAGPIAVHTPEVCYSSQDYSVAEQRSALTIRDRSEREHSLWELTMRPNDATRAPVRVLYGWGTGDRWSATKEPRFAHANAPYLYKIQLAGPNPDGSGTFDACRDFLKWFLPEVQSRLVPTAASQSSSSASHS